METIMRLIALALVLFFVWVMAKTSAREKKGLVYSTIVSTVCGAITTAVGIAVWWLILAVIAKVIETPKPGFEVSFRYGLYAFGVINLVVQIFVSRFNAR
jgi:hypothetical protein